MSRVRLRRLWRWLSPLVLLMGTGLVLGWMGAVVVVALLEAARWP